MEACVGLERLFALRWAKIGYVWSRSESLKKFEILGAMISETEEPRGKISLDRRMGQWPFLCKLLLCLCTQGLIDPTVKTR